MEEKTNLVVHRFTHHEHPACSHPYSWWSSQFYFNHQTKWFNSWHRSWAPKHCAPSTQNQTQKPKRKTVSNLQGSCGFGVVKLNLLGVKPGWNFGQWRLSVLPTPPNITWKRLEKLWAIIFQGTLTQNLDHHFLLGARLESLTVWKLTPDTQTGFWWHWAATIWKHWWGKNVFLDATHVTNYWSKMPTILPYKPHVFGKKSFKFAEWRIFQIILREAWERSMHQQLVCQALLILVGANFSWVEWQFPIVSLPRWRTHCHFFLFVHIYIYIFMFYVLIFILYLHIFTIMFTCFRVLLWKNINWRPSWSKGCPRPWHKLMETQPLMVRFKRRNWNQKHQVCSNNWSCLCVTGSYWKLYELIVYCALDVPATRWVSQWFLGIPTASHMATSWFCFVKLFNLFSSQAKQTLCLMYNLNYVTYMYNIYRSVKGKLKHLKNIWKANHCEPHPQKPALRVNHPSRSFCCLADRTASWILEPSNLLLKICVTCFSLRTMWDNLELDNFMQVLDILGY